MTNAELATQIYPKCSHRRAMLLQVLKAIDALPNKDKRYIAEHISPAATGFGICANVFEGVGVKVVKMGATS